MSWLARLNPAQRVVGRVFLWFWATFLVTAMLALWVGRTFMDDVRVGTPTTQEISDLSTAAERLSTMRRAPSLPLALVRAGKLSRTLLVAVARDSGRIVQGNGRPLRQELRDDLERLAGQSNAIALSRRGHQIVGPQLFNYRGRQFALYSVTAQPPPAPGRMLTGLIAIAVVMTVLLSYLFARHLVRPVLQVQRAARDLAEGHWDVRVSGADSRQDEIGQLARDFNLMAAQLQKMWAGQQRLLADISHELRSPLARLQMALGLAWQQQEDSETLQRVERESNRMEALIGQLLALSRAESNRGERESVAISALLENVIADAGYEAQNLNKSLDVAPLPDQPVTVDREMVCRAVENILRNALHYSAHEVKVKIETSPDSWAVIVADDGPGLPASEREQIFAPFYRTSTARDRQSGGVGLGLAIAKAAVQMHDGHIVADPSSTGGLQVTLTFPRSG
ncbi:ATP-binding protein [Alteromonas sp. ASW11-19]|uniref:histidine kinase n=1 Tax=Alteromonas salexigens TaxID=2982530 RepID=A0ABT2VJC5_9ALTE|nr:ATP-binding protein [Alteromonas salexigens]MCU7553296.1 ATP-binding protein [Alteromonas salexigens]